MSVPTTFPTQNLGQKLEFYESEMCYPKISPPPMNLLNFSLNLHHLFLGAPSVQLRQIEAKKITLRLTLNRREDLGRGTQIITIPQKSHKK